MKLIICRPEIELAYSENFVPGENIAFHNFNFIKNCKFET